MPGAEHEAIVAMLQATGGPANPEADIEAMRANMVAMTAGPEEEEGLIHVWQGFPGVPEADAAMARIGRYPGERLG